MTKTSRMLAKQKAREEALLKVATKLLVERGWHRFTMESVLSQAKLSRGTLYKHFRSREDLAMAIGVATGQPHLEFMQRASLFKGNSRARFLAISAAFRLYDLINSQCHLLHMELFRREIREKASPHWRERFLQNFYQTLGIPLGVIRDAVACNDLPAPTPDLPDRLLFAAWSQLHGMEDLYKRGVPVNVVAEQHSLISMQDCVLNHLLDGYGWKPLSRDYDFRSVTADVWQTIFPKESKPFLGELGCLMQAPVKALSSKKKPFLKAIPLELLPNNA